MFIYPHMYVHTYIINIPYGETYVHILLFLHLLVTLHSSKTETEEYIYSKKFS
jgi:hypothetical protein